jgi:hypothetical protein
MFEQKCYHCCFSLKLNAGMLKSTTTNSFQWNAENSFKNISLLSARRQHELRSYKFPFGQPTGAILMYALTLSGYAVTIIWQRIASCHTNQ